MLSTRRLVRGLTTSLIYLVLVLLCAFMIMPFIWMLSTSFKMPDEVFGFPPVLISRKASFMNYTYLLEQKKLLLIVGNTFFVSLSSSLLSLFFCSLAGYGFAKHKFPGRGPLFSFLLATMVIPGAVTMVPVFIIMRTLKWVDTFLPLIIPGAASAFGIFFMRQYISSINDELIDAARIDGAGEFSIYSRIILPIISPGLVSLGLIFFMGSWNNYLWPLIILKSPDKFTIPLAIASFGGAVGLTNYNAQMAMSVISIIPLLIIFLAFQKRFVEGITAGAVKG
jgi:ABC-type glycerol-3-phosphate transport system permease component